VKALGLKPSRANSQHRHSSEGWNPVTLLWRDAAELPAKTDASKGTGFQPSLE
jgi:hypothetical protein